MPNENLHSIQTKILRELTLKSSARFSELNTDKIENDQFNFHLKRLLALNLIQKNSEGIYELTESGKSYVGKLDPQELNVEKQSKICVMVICRKKNANGDYEYLLQERLRNPYFGSFNFIIRKIKWGENSIDAVKRILKKDTGLDADLIHKGFLHKIDLNNEKIILEDTLFYIYLADNCSGNLILDIGEGKNYWYSEIELLKLENIFPNTEELIQKIDNSEIFFLELSTFPEKY